MVRDIRPLSSIGALALGVVSAVIATLLAIQMASGTADFRAPGFVVVATFILNLILVPILLFLATRISSLLLPALSAAHVSFGIIFVFYDEVYSPFSPLWAALALLTAMYFGWKGFVWSNLAFLTAATSYIVIYGQYQPDENNSPYTLAAAMVMAMTLLLSYIFVKIVFDSQEKNKELMKARYSEQIQINRSLVLINSMDNPVLTLTIDGIITSQNSAAQAFFDTNESLIGKHIDGMFQLHDQINRRVTIASLIKNTKSSIIREDISIGSGPAKIRLMIQVSKIRVSFKVKDQGVVLIIRDITKQKTLEEEKDEFISVVSHELRTPIAIAEGSLSNLILMQERNVEKNKIHEASVAAHHQVVYLAQMINDLSTLSRAERGVGDDVELIDTPALLHELFSRYKPEADLKNLQLNLDVPSTLPSIQTSKLYLEEILQNFITNSLKYTQSGSVTITAKQLNNKHVCFSVSDTGIGMTKSDISHIFEKFYRSEDFRTRETSGTGLGLYVVNKLAEKLGIKIKVTSRINHGSTFSFDIPLTPPVPAIKEPVDNKPATKKQ